MNFCDNCWCDVAPLDEDYRSEIGALKIRGHSNNSKVKCFHHLIFEASVRSAHLGLLYFCLVQLDAEDLCSQPLETDVHLRKERETATN